MAENHREWERCDIILQRCDYGQASVELNVPIAAAKLLCDGVESFFGGDGVSISRALEIEPHTPHADRRHVIESGGGDRFVDDDNAAGACAELADGIDRAGIVGPINAWCYDDGPVEVKCGLQIAQVIDRGLRGRVNPFTIVGKMRRIEHMHMAIAGATGNIEVDHRSYS